MAQFSNFNYPPPKNWQDFETLCRDLWRKIWNDRNTRKNGRSGQDQDGVDVYGQPDQGHDWAGVQCKGKDNTYEKRNVTESELLEEIEKAKNFDPPLSEWTLATTGPRDAKIEKKVRKLNSEHKKKGLFSVHIWFWEDIVEEIGNYPELMALHFSLPQIDQENFTQINTKLDKAETGIQTLAENSAQQTAILEENTLAVGKMSNDVAAILQIRTQDILTPYINADIDHIRDQINRYRFNDAIKVLENIKSRIWSDAPELIKFRILSNFGSAYYGLGKLD